MMAFSPAALTSRLARLRGDLAQAGLDALVVSHPANIRYLTSFHGSAGALLITAAHCHLVVDFRYASVARGVAEASAVVEAVVAELNVDDSVAELVRLQGAARIGIEGHSMSVARFNRLAARLASPHAPALGGATGSTLVPTERIVERARAVKDESEIATLREAARRLAAVAADVPALAREGRREIEVAADIDGLLRAAGFERPAFDTIVASGPNGALPHARPGGRRLAANEGVVLDFGGVYDGYCVDLTRTVALGRPTPEWTRMAAAVAEAQRAALAAVKPGVPCSQVDAAARAVLAGYGLDKAFGHGTGHGLGLEVHEEPRISRPVPGQAEDVLAPGMVFTVEPGAYVEGIGGVRLEDDVLVTESGGEVLTLALTRALRDTTHGGG